MENSRDISVLVIDDDNLVRENIAAYLEDSEFSVFQAQDGQAGLDVFFRKRPDLILVDLDMPVLSGYAVIEKITQDSPEVPIIIVSGAGEVESAIKASRMGAWDFIVKPIHNMAMVEHTIWLSLEKQKLLKENREYRENLEQKVVQQTRELEHRSDELLASNKKLKDEIEIRKLAEAQLRLAKNRSVSLRHFSNRISEFVNEASLLKAALNELCSNIYLSGAILFHGFESRQFRRYDLGLPVSEFLKMPLNYDMLKKLFADRSQEFALFNHLTMDWLVNLYSANAAASEIKNGHFVFIRAHSLHQHIFVLMLSDSGSGRFIIENWYHTIMQNSHEPASAVIDIIMYQLNEFISQNDQTDDVCIVLIKKR